MRQPPGTHLPPVPLQHPIWEELVGEGIPRRLAPGEVLYRQGDPARFWYYVHAGRVQASILRADGTEKIIEVMGPGSILGEGPACDGLPYFATVVALDPSLVYAFPAAALPGFMGRRPQVAMHLLRMMARKQRVLALQVEDMAFLGATARVARLFLRLLRDYGVPDREGTRIHLRLTHEQMAGITGLCRVSVTRAVGRLKRQGVLAATPAGWVVRDPEALAAAAGADGPAVPGRAPAGG